MEALGDQGPGDQGDPRRRPNDYGVYLRRPDGSEAGRSWDSGQDDAVAAKADVAGDWFRAGGRVG